MYYDQKIKNGLFLLSEGHIKEADEIFCAILSENPDFPEALYGRACVARAAGEPALAIGLVGKAIELKPESYYYITLGLALYEQGHLIEAEVALISASLLNSADPRAYHGLAIVQEAMQNRQKAELSFRKAVELYPSSLFYWKELIRFYWQDQAFDQALKIAQDSVKYNVGKIEFLHELAVILSQLNLLGDAERVFRKIIRLNPIEPSAHANLGAILFRLNRLKEAKEYLTYAYNHAPQIVETQVNFGLVLMAMGNLVEAKILLQQAYQHEPLDYRIALNLGTILYELRELDKAEQIYRHLLEQAQTNSMAKMDFYKIEYNLSSVLLAKGEFKEGWERMEARHSLLHHFTENDPIPVWNGKDPSERLLVRVEQGLGDTLHFARYLPILLRKHSLIIEAPKVLVRLLQAIMRSCRQENMWQVIEKGNMLPDGVTHQIMLMSLPYLLQIEDIPFYQLHLDPLSDKKCLSTRNILKIGLCWTGNKEYRFDLLRSIPVSKFSNILSLPNIKFYALQAEIKKKDLPKGFVDVLPQGDLLDVAQFIQQLDLVITVDTMIAHLAGILGKPVWLLNRFGGDWRWYPSQQDQEGTSLWYPTLKIFKQQEILPHDQAWNRLLEEVKLALEKGV